MMNINKKVGVVADNRLFDHKIAGHTPENPQRLREVYLELDKPEYADKLQKYSARPVTDEELYAVHSRFYIEQIRSCGEGKNPYAYDKDTYLMQDSLYVAKLAAGGCLSLADAIMSGEIDRGFALVRPPGHHAGTGFGMGFCILNNVALTAQHLINKYNLNRILVLDFDVHHGNGTQEIFYNTDKVLFVSLHQENLFPFTGKAGEFGTNEGYGYNINFPVHSQYGDLEFSYIIGKSVHNIAEYFLPQFILVSAGYDAHKNDNISDTSVTTAGYKNMVRIVKHLAHKYCNEKLMFILEGGYNLDSLNDSMIATLDELININHDMPGIAFSERADSLINTELKPVIKDKWVL